MRQNLILNADSYKASHYLQYPPDTTHISCYIESRGGQFAHTLFFGLQMFLKQYLTQPITAADIDEAEDLLQRHGLPFNRQGWEYIVKQHGGLLPLAIEAVAEGTYLPIHNVLVQLINTDPRCFWLPTYIETALLRAVWYPTTVATVSWHCKQIIRRYLLETADSLDSLPFKLHDFGARGVSSQESAQIGALAHLVNFTGSDTLAGVVAARDFYQESMAAHSIPAAEHSTIITWGKQNETQAYQHLLDLFAKKNQMVSVVSDSYNLWQAIEQIWGQTLKERVLNNAGVLIVRPDSGYPATVVTKTIEALMDKFSFRTNRQGYRVLPDNIRLIQGDGISIDTIEECLEAMKRKKISAENVAFGMGGALLQRVNRDTQAFAMKPNAIQRNGEWIDVFKTPMTDPAKTSKPGRLALVTHQHKSYQTIKRSELGDRHSELVPVFKNGKILQEYSLEEIRQRSEDYFI